MSGLLMSASSTSLHEECLRKFAFRYICKIESPTTASQALGKDVDDNKLQPWLKSGIKIETESVAGQIAAAGLELLPPPKYPGLEVQKRFIMPSPSGLFSWQGYIDLWLPKRGLPNFGLLSDTVPIVVDFKTTKSWEWVKASEDLAVDPQAQLYAMYALWSTRQPEVDLVWTYFKTKPPYKARRSHYRATASHVAEQFLRLEDIARRAVALRQRGEGLEGQAAMNFALALPPSPEACDNFGGCPHRHLCNLSPADFIGPDIQPLNSIGSDKRLIRRLPVVPSQETLDLFASLESDVQTLGINPPEKNLPPAPAVGVLDAAEEGEDDDEAEEAPPPAVAVEEKPKAKRGRKPKAQPTEADKAQIEKDLEEIRAEIVPPSVDFDVAWAELGSALKRFFIVAGKKDKVA